MDATFYLSNAAAGYSPATWRGSWESMAPSPVTRAPSATKIGAQAYAYTGTVAADTDCGVLRFVSAALGSDEAFGGTVDIGIGTEGNSNNLVAHVHIYVTQGDSDTPRGTLLADWTGMSLFGGFSTGGRVATGLNLSAVSALAGDRIVIEVGVHAYSSPGGYLYYGGTGNDITQGGPTYTANTVGWATFHAPQQDTGFTVTQAVVEALDGQSADVALTQNVIEVLQATAVPVYVTQAVIEALAEPPVDPKGFRSLLAFWLGGAGVVSATHVPASAFAIMTSASGMTANRRRQDSIGSTAVSDVSTITAIRRRHVFMDVAALTDLIAVGRRRRKGNTTYEQGSMSSAATSSALFGTRLASAFIHVIAHSAAAFIPQRRRVSALGAQMSALAVAMRPTRRVLGVLGALAQTAATLIAAGPIEGFVIAFIAPDRLLRLFDAPEERYTKHEGDVRTEPNADELVDVRVSRPGGDIIEDLRNA